MNTCSTFDWNEACPLDTVDSAEAQLAFLHHRRRRMSDARIDDVDWAILLEAFVAQRKGRVLASKAFGEVAGVPQSTLLRHLDALEIAGYLSRTPHATDRRIRLVAITPAGRRLVADVFDLEESAP